MRIRVDISTGERNRFWWPIEDLYISVDQLVDEILTWCRGAPQPAIALIMDYKLRPEDIVGDVIKENDVVSIEECIAPGSGSMRTKKRNLRRRKTLQKTLTDELSDTGIVIINEVVNCDDYSMKNEEHEKDTAEAAYRSQQLWDSPRAIDRSADLKPNTLVFISYFGAFPPSYTPGVYRCFARVIENNDDDLSVQVHANYLSDKKGRFELENDYLGTRTISWDQIITGKEYGLIEESETGGAFNISGLPTEPETLDNT